MNRPDISTEDVYNLLKTRKVETRRAEADSAGGLLSVYLAGRTGRGIIGRRVAHMCFQVSHWVFQGAAERRIGLWSIGFEVDICLAGLVRFSAS